MSLEYTKELMLDFGTDGKTLIPVITQDIKTKKVLILAYVNKDAYEESMKSGYVTFYSRSRNQLWKKGSTSGDYLRLSEVRINCEQNSLLFLVNPVGKGVCHAKNPDGDPYRSCYYRRIKDGTLELVESESDEKGNNPQYNKD